MNTSTSALVCSFSQNRSSSARRTFTEASTAEQGEVKAQANLGQMYSDGRGVPQDYATAAAWFRKAAEQCSDRAQLKLGFMYYEGRGVPQDYAAAVSWYRRAAEQGEVRTQHNLGSMYANGQGVPQDYVQAHMWFNLASSRYEASDKEDLAQVVKNRDLVASKMTPAQIAEAQRLAREWKPKPER